MLKDTLALLTKMKAEDGNKSHIAAIDKQIASEETHETAQGTLKTEHATFKATHDAVGDRKVGELIGFVDAMKEAGLDTAAKVIDLKAKAEGDSATLEQRELDKVAMQKTIDSGVEGIEASKKETAKTLLLAETKIALSEVVGAPKTFNLTVKELLSQETVDKKPRVTMVDDVVMYDNKPIIEAIEDFRKDYVGAFTPTPDGTDLGGGGSGKKPNEGKVVTMEERMKKGFK